VRTDLFIARAAICIVLLSLLDGCAPVNPVFPWPPPRPSALYVLPNNLLVPSTTQPSTIGQVSQRLTNALDAAGYAEIGYYALPSGFVMATQLEQYQDDGSPGIPRWSSAAPVIHFSIKQYVRDLFEAQPGHYRVVVFIVTNQPFVPSRNDVSPAVIRGFVGDGLVWLPPEIDGKTFTPAHHCVAFIYEFKQEADGTCDFVAPSELTAIAHLDKAGITHGLLAGEQP
jgi:hypothetical protein